MKRSLIVVIVVLVVFMALGTLMTRDPGYVLLSYRGMTLQTGLWVFLVTQVLVIITSYYLIKSFKVISNSGRRLADWRASRRLKKSHDFTAKGEIFLQTGEYERAEKFLLSGAQYNDNPLVNYIGAAKAADALNKAELREKYLRQAKEVDLKNQDAVAIASAEMHFARQEWALVEAAVGHLVIPKVLPYRKEALLQLGKWEELLGLMPQIKKTMTDEAARIGFEKRVALGRLKETDVSEEGSTAVYRKLSEPLKLDFEVVCEHLHNLSNLKDKEAVIISVLKRQWQDELAVQFGMLGGEHLARRLKVAEGWQKQHPDNWAVHLCMGYMQESKGDKQAARTAFERSLSLRPSIEAHEALGRLMAFDGEYLKSSEHFRAALSLKS